MEQPPEEQPQDNMSWRPKRGFARLSPEQRRLMASLGGKKTQRLGKAHNFTSETAREAGRKSSRRGRTNKPKPKNKPEQA